jgi:hypothetical protein
MLIISEEQMKRLGEDFLQRVRADVIKRVVTRFPTHYRPGPGLDALVDNAMEEGCGHGLSTYRDLAWWVVASAMFLGENPLWAIPWATALLEDDELSAPARTVILRDQLIRRKDDLLPAQREDVDWLVNLA